MESTVTRILANDLQKGDLVIMRGTGWTYRIENNKKGLIRDIFSLFAPEQEYGSCYVHDIAYVAKHKGTPFKAGTVTVELTPAQLKQAAKIKAAGF